MEKRSKNIPPDERPHFFKIMFPGFSTMRLRIPPDFVEHISTEAYKLATLEDSCGNHWHVKLSKTTSGTYIEDGWQDFIKDHSIYDHNFLVFGYDGNICFDVKIFDGSACERDYVFSTKPNQESAFSDGTKKCDKSSETSTDCVQKVSKDDPGQLLSTFKLNGLQKAKREDVELTHEPLSKTICSSSRRRPATEEEKAKIWKEAESFTSKFPCFLRCLTESNVHRGFYVYIPIKFARTHGHIQQNGKVTLRNRKGQAWRINLVYTSRGRTFLCGGWREFVRANKLQEADICVFELVGKFEMHVHIFQAVKKV
ncbi:B3 domain-containing protein Os11g0197600-like isoform X2 [Telopea speciosissima]|uniref:B3 domain-containing protein Os11g0197600-like isoform X2 n=1 Tax=Telopea speciosissima TaxID=54955 RepID=UPI001CC36CAA|nr:B3 domain-containing protein Os11g0197600-like isoform X2 [Telopea speciosissima]